MGQQDRLTPARGGSATVPVQMGAVQQLETAAPGWAGWCFAGGLLAFGGLDYRLAGRLAPG
ncbi:MAG: hypothetical protein WBD29_04095, partial [Candidatus Competibacter sp.]